MQTPLGKRASVSSLFWDADGRLLAAGTSDGSGVLVRYSADGALDATFGDAGIRRTPLGEDLRVSAALQQADGHLLVVASGNTSVQLARYDRDGKPDPRFGSNGVITTAVGKRVGPMAGLAIDDKGIPMMTVVSDHGFFLLRYSPGSPADVRYQTVPTMHP